MESFILRIIVSELTDRVTSWKTTIPGGLLAAVAAILTHTGLISPKFTASLSGQIAQWIVYGAGLLLLAWKDRKTTSDLTPTPGPGKDA